MIIDLNIININKVIEFEYPVFFNDELDKRIKDLKNSVVKGKVYENINNEIVLECEFTGTMYIEDSITLELVPYGFRLIIDELLSEIKENYQDAYKIDQNTLDLRTILWQNIVLEVPISFSKATDAKLEGDGWELLNDEKKDKEIDPRLKKLEDYWKGDD